MLLKKWVYGGKGYVVKEIHELHRVRTKKDRKCYECGKVLPAGSEVYCYIIKTITHQYSGEWKMSEFPIRMYYCLECGYRTLIEEM